MEFFTDFYFSGQWILLIPITLEMYFFLANNPNMSSLKGQRYLILLFIESKGDIWENNMGK